MWTSMGRWDWENLGEVTLRESAAALAGRGYGHVRAEELARAGGMSVGSFYRRYGSKAGFAREVRQWAETELCRIARVDFELAPEQPERSFREVFDSFWEDLAWCATRKPELFHFTFMHWHPDSLEPEALGAQAREVVREVLANGERVGALAPGSVRVGEGLIWGALAELVRAVARGAEQDALENVSPMGRVLWKALAAAEDSGAGGGRTPPLDGAGTEGTEAAGTGTTSLEGAGSEGAETEGAGTPSLEGAGSEGAETEGASTTSLEGAGSEDAETEGAATPSLEGAAAEDAETEDAGTTSLESAGSEDAETEGAATPSLEGAVTEDAETEDAGTTSLGRAVAEGAEAGGEGTPLLEGAATEDSEPGGVGASRAGATTLEAFGREDPGAGRVGTPLSGQVSGDASAARDSGAEALGATGVRRGVGSSRSGMRPPGRQRSRAHCSVRRSNPSIARQRPAPCSAYGVLNQPRRARLLGADQLSRAGRSPRRVSAEHPRTQVASFAPRAS
ncbi:TetR family transcriptional regulator [Pyxidicoccus fallax]|uniref:TetR family transcriptional regulator n=2 Tax=Pyxidicoccus fallax TaxID=394095 RepID=A0A848LPG6_9BACT|nr:TetR family transcriptional regulator [Pyxidicoccus fallax]